MRPDFLVALRSPLVLALFGLLAVAPFGVSSYHLGVLFLALAYGALATGWNIVGGMGGMLSLVHSVFVGIGALLAGALLVRLGLNLWIGALLAAMASAAMGAGVAFLDFRFRLGHLLFALVTLALAEMGLLVVLSWDFVGGAGGLFLPRDGGDFAKLEFGGLRGAYWTMLALAALCIVANLAVRHSALGFRLRAIRDNGAAAQAIGVPLLRTKMVAMAISAALASLVGTVWGRQMTYLDPTVLMSVHLTVEIVLVATVGGLGRPFGPLVGALLLVPVGEILRGKFGNSLPGMHSLIYGLVVIWVVMATPRGVLAMAETGWRRITGTTRATTPPARRAAAG